MTQIHETGLTLGEDISIVEWTKALAEAPLEVSERFFRSLGATAVEEPEAA